MKKWLGLSFLFLIIFTQLSLAGDHSYLAFLLDKSKTLSSREEMAEKISTRPDSLILLREILNYKEYPDLEERIRVVALKSMLRSKTDGLENLLVEIIEIDLKELAKAGAMAPFLDDHPSGSAIAAIALGEFHSEKTLEALKSLVQAKWSYTAQIAATSLKKIDGRCPKLITFLKVKGKVLSRASP
ncbi:MAG: hypothetical protein JWQ35_853 [Bacteriovoracaceae bacterium]|nr:hypothetical protein [Bacteriovoracaceae bacterium]